MRIKTVVLALGLARLLTGVCLGAADADFVTPFALDGLVQAPGHFFDWQGRTLRFQPAGGGTYKVQKLAAASLVPCADKLDYAQGTGWPAHSWELKLPFPFLFAGTSWDKVFINNNGNFGFGKPESELYPQRDPWPEGGMRSVAGALDDRSGKGLERMIAVLWSTWHADAHQSSVAVHTGKDLVAVTWDVTRLNWGHRPAGKNVFQGRLYPDGTIEMAFMQVTERDGIVGLFKGDESEKPEVAAKGRKKSAGSGRRPLGNLVLSEATNVLSGNIFTVFHYPKVTKRSESLLASVYKRYEAHDDIAIVFTDFRIDDLFCQGGGAVHANFVIHGTGPRGEHPRSTASIGSRQLQMTAATVWPGGQKFDETGTTDNSRYGNYAFGVGWLAHETSHYLGPMLRFLNPATGQVEELADKAPHWLEGLNTPVVFPVASRYTTSSEQGYSIMGGAPWKENGDGTFSRFQHPFQVPGGYSALDLYIMGLTPPEQVPATFLLKDLKDLGNNRYSANKVTVRIQDIVAAMGPRLPAYGDSQKEFAMRFYLMHPPGREPDAVMLARTIRLARGLKEFYEAASGGRMRVRPSALVPRERVAVLGILDSGRLCGPRITGTVAGRLERTDEHQGYAGGDRSDAG